MPCASTPRARRSPDRRALPRQTLGPVLPKLDIRVLCSRFDLDDRTGTLAPAVTPVTDSHSISQELPLAVRADLWWTGPVGLDVGAFARCGGLRRTHPPGECRQ